MTSNPEATADYTTAIFLIVSLFGVFYIGVLIIRVFQIAKSYKAKPNVVKPNASRFDDNPDESTDEDKGFAYFNVADEKKTMFLDAMNGLRDFARLKGYVIEIDTSSGKPNKVGIKIVIVDTEITASKSSVRKDVDDYIYRLSNGDDFGDMPMVVDSLEHMRLVSALKMRLTFVRSEADQHKQASAFYNSLLNETRETMRSGLLYGPGSSQTVHVKVITDGSSSMGDNIIVNKSPNSAVGRNNTVNTIGSEIFISEDQQGRQKEHDSIQSFIESISSSNIDSGSKSKVIRALENVRDEINEPRPNNLLIGKWLNGASKILKDVDVGIDLIEKFNSLIGAFTSAG